ncbi:MAG: lamin tail domain-containing protein [bacterium]
MGNVFGRLFILSMAVFVLLLGSFGASVCGVTINEIMYAPESGEPEWVEIYNRGDGPVDLKGWTIEDSDSTRPRLLTAVPMELAPDGYVLIVQDLADFLSLHPNVLCPVLKPLSGWPRLNNDEDRIVLRDSTRALIDRVAYEGRWGGGDGKSLERINPSWASEEPESWSTSVSDSKSTPCAQNSIYASSFVRKASLSVDPDPFEGETTISYELTVPTAIVKLEVYDIRGRLVRRLIDQESSGSTGEVVWTGRDDRNRRLRMGVYILYLEAMNAQMGVLDRAKKSVTLARRVD